MAQPDGSLVFDTKIITTGFNKGMAAIKTAAKGIGAITAGFAAATGAALKFAGELEQNLGGSEAVFKQYASTIQKTADTAFKNMGLSTADFLATANKMGALFQGSGFQIQESAELSAKTMQRAADVASIMGIDISMAMESIAGAAKGNFTMMDNLGVAMNDTTLAAYALEKGIAKSTRQMTNQEKIALAMQMFLEKTEYATGNYAKENETLAGSLATAKAALENFLAGTGKAEDLAESLSGAARVIIENIGELTPKLAAGLSDVFAELTPMMPSMLEQLVDGVLDGADELADSFGDMFSSVVTIAAGSAPDILDASILLMESFIDGIVDNSDDVAAAAIEVGEAVISGFVKIVPKAVSAAGEIAEAFADELGKAYPIFKPFTSIVKLLADNVELCTATFIAFKVATTGFAVLQGLTASFQTANLQLALFAAQNGKAALSSTTLTAALTAKELVVGVLTGKINLLTAAQTLLNKAWAANPVGVVVGGVTALVAGLALLNKAIDDSRVISNMLSNEIENLANKARGAREEFDSFSSMQEKNIESSESEFIQLQKLADELKVITDESGNVTDANKAQAEFILNELNEALGTEYTMLGNQIQQYQELAESIDILIMKKRAEAKLDYMNEAYKKANGEIEAQKELVKELSDQLAIAQEMEPYKGLEGKAAVQEAQTALKDAQDLLKEYQEDIEDFNAAWIAVELGDYDALFDGTYKNYKAASEGMTTALEEGKAGVDETVDAINEKISFVIPNTADALSAFPAVVNSAFGTSIESAKILGENLVLNFQNGTKMIMPNIISAAENDGQLIVDALALAKELAPQLGTDYIQGVINGINARSSELWTTAFNAAQNITSGAKAGVRSNSPAKDGIDLGTDYVLGVEIGLEDEAPELNKTAKETAQGMNKSFADTLSHGMNTIRSEIASITGAIKEEAEKNVKAFDAELKKIEMLRDFGIDDEETYYRKLEFLRDNYLTKNSDKWIDITQELYDYQEAQLEEHRDNIEDVYDDIADHITDKLDEVAKKQQKFSDSLTDSTELFQKYTIDGVVHYKLNDFSSANVNLAAYQQWLSKAMERVKSSGASDDAISGVLDYIDGLAGDESGMDALIALASASDADFAKFMSGYAQNLSKADGIAAQRYSDDMVTAAEESYQQMVDELTKAGLDIPEGFFVSGTLSAEQFGEAFLSEIELQMQEIRRKLTEFNAEINASIGAAAGNVTNDNRSTTYHIYGDNSNSTVKQIQNMETIKRLSGQ